jgi:hypothetical protein
MVDVPVPDLLPVASTAAGDLTELVLELYRELASARRDAELAARQAAERIHAHTLETNRTIAALAAERFEFERLMKRIQPELDALAAQNVSRVLDLFRRSWASELARQHVELRDLTGEPFTSELAEMVDVNAVLDDPAIAEPIVHEMLVPLVLHHDRVVGKAIVNKAVPSAPERSS